ncbi:MAG: hypothetical protein V8T45_01885 [Oscillospiraceae bacterium]
MLPGSAPTAEPGYRFVGWYKDEDCTEPVEADWVTDNKITPQKTEDLWTAATYYARFDYAYADLTINVGGLEGTYETQGTIYQVTVDADDGISDKTFYVSIAGNTFKTIKDLPYGTYTVTPMNDWSWRYVDQTASTVTPVQNQNGDFEANAQFAYTIDNNKWLSGNAYFVCGSSSN